MIATMRSKFGPVIIGGIIGLVAFVFIFYGVFMPGKGGGLSGGPGVVGEVNGESITFNEYSRELSQRIEFFKSMMGGKVSDDQIAKFGIREQVFNDIARRKLLTQMAKEQGFYPSAEEVREHILGMEVFKKDGRFDKVHYKNVLNQNGYTPARFEDLISEEMAGQMFRSFLSNMAVVGSSEVDAELKKTKEKRKLRYVYIDHESIRKTLSKDLKPDEMNKKVSEKVEQISASLIPLVTTGKTAQADALLKPYSLKTKTSDWLTTQAGFVPGVGSIQSAQQEIFSMKKNEAAKKFSLIGGTLVTTIAEAEYFDASKITAKDRSEVQNRLQSQKQNELVQGLVEFWFKKSKINKNNSIVSAGESPSTVPITADQ